MIRVEPLRASDRARWDVLARGYKSFYETTLSDAEYDRAWSRLMQSDGIYGLGAHLDQPLVGITHYLFHPSVWSADVCYLQDLFTASEVRGRGVTRALYDKVAAQRGFIRYDCPMG